jgi:hypoxanthine phosphoribosyltransferase
MKFLYLEWKDIEELVEGLADKMDGFNPDVLIGISRGGLVPVRLLSDYLNNPNVAIFRIEFYKGIGQTNEKPEITHPLTIDVKGKKVLIVDDVSDSGKSLIVAKEYIEKLGAKEVRIATLHYKPRSSFKPDYYVGETDAWIVYPWEKKEAKREIEKL